MRPCSLRSDAPDRQERPRCGGYKYSIYKLGLREGYIPPSHPSSSPSYLSSSLLYPVPSSPTSPRLERVPCEMFVDEFCLLGISGHKYCSGALNTVYMGRKGLF